jgi:ADP-ribose pyrophosphatase YjhB (NUDIX family)
MTAPVKCRSMIRPTKSKSDRPPCDLRKFRRALPRGAVLHKILRAVRNAVEPALRRGFHLYWRMSRGLTLGVRGLVVDEAGRIFLVKHTYVRGWHLPGGGVEPGETLLDALARELKEEGNIDLLEPPALHAVYFNTAVSRRDHVALFVIGAFRQPAPPMPDHEIMAHGFFAPDALPEDTVASVRARVAEVTMGAPVSQRW